MKCLECVTNLLKKCEKAYKERILEENNHFLTIKKGLRESMNNIDKAMENIESWDELMNIKEESLKDINLIRNKTIKAEYKQNKYLFGILGFSFCVLQLIGVQAGIIILNSLFSEIADEFALMTNKTPRRYNFYEKLEINSYRELPEIDVGMVTSSIGIIVLKEIGFPKSNSIFQLIPTVLLYLLFMLFNFHTGNELTYNYNRTELFFLILSYIILSILVGCSSTLAMKEYFELSFKVFHKYDIKEDKKEDTNEDTNEEGIQKIAFVLLSGISAFLMIFINRLIFTSIDNKASLGLLISILVVCFISFFLSLIFYFAYSFAVTNKERRETTNLNLEDEENDKKEDQTIENENKKSENENKKNEKEEEKSENRGIINIDNGNKEENRNEDKENNSNNIIKTIKFIDIVNPPDSELSKIKKNQISQQNDKINKKENTKKKKKPIYSTKVCTFCGYVYFKKEKGNQKACVIYYYTNKCTWLREKIIKFDVMTSIIIEFYCQFCIIGYNSILYEKLYDEYSYEKNLKFFTALFFLCLFFGCIFSFQINKSLKKFMETYETNEQKKEGQTILNKKYNYFFFYMFAFLLGFTFLTFISSICYIASEDKNRERWDNIIMAEYIYFKIIDMTILSFFDFFDNSDFFNNTLFITLEKFIWMIIEEIFDAIGAKEKTLVALQIVISLIPILFLIYLIVVGCYACYIKKNKHNNK